MKRIALPKRSISLVAALGLTAALLSVAVISPTQAQPGFAPTAQHARATTFVNGAGSSFIYLLMNRWAFVYGTQVEKGVRVNYQRVGYSPGVAEFIKGQVDFAGADSFLFDSQIKAAGGDVLHLPLALYPLTITYNLPGLTVPLQLDGQTLAQIFQGKVTVWNQPPIAALNPGVTLPKLPITVVHRVDLSGTTFTLSSYLSAVDADWKRRYGAAANVAFPVGVGARSSASQLDALNKTPGSISYFELSFAIDNKLAFAAIKNRAGFFTLPSLAGTTYDAANAPLPADLRTVIVNAPGADSYPISGLSWVLIHQHAPNTTSYPALLRFLWWCARAGQAYAASGALRFAPLPPELVTAIEASIKSVTYNGTPLYTPIAGS